MKLYITPNSLKGTVKIIASKSLSHRYLIAASLTSGASEIDNLMVSDDIFATKAALRQLGAKIDEPLIKGPLNLKEAITIDAYASGSTLRFLIPIAYLFNQFVTFIGRDRLPKRSLKVYETLFKQEGLLYEKLSHDELPLKIKGPLNASHFKIKGDVSSQFISGLLFAASCLKNDTSIEIIPPFESKPYVDLTVETLKDFNISITEEPLRYTIKGNQTFKPVRKTIEGDYSQAAFFIVAALIGEHPLVIKGLNEHSLQGDKAILEIVKAMGGSFNFNQGDLTVYPSLTHSTTISLKNIPDLGPILMILAAL
ncbi:MAG: 3-phosphoshikimate 1-carboxyvinyltransferase, partial [Candidatus Izemoplasmataceae bacterium]